MAVKMRRSTSPAISDSGMYWAEILSVNTCKTKSGSRKVILELRPHYFETEQMYQKVDVWLADNEESDARVGALLDSLPENCEEDLEQAVGESIGIEVSVNDTPEKTYLNITDFFQVSDGEEDEPIEDDTEDDEDFDDEFISSEIRTRSRNKKS